MVSRNVIDSDLSGKPDAATATFGLGGTWYEIDLTAEEQKKLEEVLKPYREAGRKAGKTTPAKKQVVPETTAEERDRIREWAKKEGYDLAERGRITKKVMKAFDEAHGIDRSK
ncbi:Lsr2 family protein [Streptomyces sp. 110]|uniref:Lsr2 family protein n=1 Tax=Streptomyces endocoffeicus TaxID=2898945 RepID=A0ABS1PSM9_9ACTN|nr:Lsr2 family protein [Streptomyces endocoffeicus]MBL1115433.1 Lsr2 family protein [Streptomyces endocoffeicus]